MIAGWELDTYLCTFRMSVTLSERKEMKQNEGDMSKTSQIGIRQYVCIRWLWQVNTMSEMLKESCKELIGFIFFILFAFDTAIKQACSPIIYTKRKRCNGASLVKLGTQLMLKQYKLAAAYWPSR